MSQRGLKRHMNTKHKEKQQQQATTEKPLSAEQKLHPLLLNFFLKASVENLAANEYYPQHIMDEFKAISFSTLDDVLPWYTLVKHVIYTFNGDAEKYYPEFYKVFNDAATPFTGLSRHSSLLVGF